MVTVCEGRTMLTTTSLPSGQSMRIAVHWASCAGGANPRKYTATTRGWRRRKHQRPLPQSSMSNGADIVSCLVAFISGSLQDAIAWIRPNHRYRASAYV
jgi:hypothetical protein